MKHENLVVDGIVASKFHGALYRVLSTSGETLESFTCRCVRASEKSIPTGNVSRLTKAYAFRKPRLSDLQVKDVFRHRRHGDGQLITYTVVSKEENRIIAQGVGVPVTSTFYQLDTKIEIVSVYQPPAQKTTVYVNQYQSGAVEAHDTENKARFAARHKAAVYVAVPFRKAD